MTDAPDIDVRSASHDGSVLVVLRGAELRMSRDDFDALAVRVDAFRDAEIGSKPPFERLKAALDGVLEIASSKGEEQMVWNLTIDAINKVYESGLLKSCGLEDEKFMDVVDEGYADETASMASNVRYAIEKIEPMLPKPDKPAWDY